MPRVTVLVPTHNRPEMLREALDSLIGQTFTDWRALVFDNGGSSGSDGVVCGLDPRIGYMWFPSDPLSRHGRRLLDVWEDGYGCYLHDDDRLPPDSLEKRVAYMDANPEVDVSVCAMTYWTGHSYIGVRDRDPANWRHDFASFYDQTNTPTLMFRSKPPCYQDFGIVSGCDDVLWQYEMYLRGFRFGYVAEPLYDYRIHAGQESNRARLAQRQDDIAAVHQIAERLEASL